MKNSLSVACLALIGGICVAGAQQTARSTSSGVFTTDQAKMANAPTNPDAQAATAPTFEVPTPKHRI